MPVIVIAIVAIEVRACIPRLQAYACSTYEISRSEAPDQRHVAVLKERTCALGPLGGTSQSIFMQSKDSTVSGSEIFTTDLAEPILSWTDASHFLITISEVAWIGTSLHRVDGVAIDYRLSDRMSDDQIAQRSAARDQKRMVDYLKNPSPPPQGSFGGYVLAKKFEKETLEKFKAWARANIPGAYR